MSNTAQQPTELVRHPREVAWVVSIYEMRCVVFASSKAKAQWIAVKSYRDAYGNSGTWPTCRAVRKAEYDKFPDPERKAYSEEYVRTFCPAREAWKGGA